MKTYTVRETYTKSDVWYNVKAKNEEEAIKKIQQLNKPDDEEYGLDTFTEAEESEGEE